MTSGSKGLKQLRSRTFKVAAVVVALSVLGLLFLYSRKPLAAGATDNSWHFSPELFEVVQNLLTTLLGIGLLSLVFEFFLRDAYARELLRFVNMRAAIVKSGLQHFSSTHQYDWKDVLDGATIAIFVRNPAEWFQNQMPVVLENCQRRRADIVVHVPDKNSVVVFEAIASSAGVTAAELEANIDTAIAIAKTQWKQIEPHAHSQSGIEFRPLEQVLLHDMALADDQISIVLSRAAKHEIGDEQLVLGIEQSSGEYPSTWIRGTIDALPKTNAIWAARKP